MPTVKLTAEERTLLDDYRALSKAGRRAVDVLLTQRISTKNQRLIGRIAKSLRVTSLAAVRQRRSTN